MVKFCFYLLLVWISSSFCFALVCFCVCFSASVQVLVRRFKFCFPCLLLLRLSPLLFLLCFFWQNNEHTMIVIYCNILSDYVMTYVCSFFWIWCQYIPLAFQRWIIKCGDWLKSNPHQLELWAIKISDVWETVSLLCGKFPHDRITHGRISHTYFPHTSGALNILDIYHLKI